jgi:hypothetical protein
MRLSELTGRLLSFHDSSAGERLRRLIPSIGYIIALLRMGTKCLESVHQVGTEGDRADRVCRETEALRTLHRLAIQQSRQMVRRDRSRRDARPLSYGKPVTIQNEALPSLEPVIALR